MYNVLLLLNQSIHKKLVFRICLVANERGIRTPDHRFMSPRFYQTELSHWRPDQRSPLFPEKVGLRWCKWFVCGCYLLATPTFFLSSKKESASFKARTTRVSNPVRYPRFRTSASVLAQRVAFATGVPPNIYEFHLYTRNSTLLYQTQEM